MYTFNLYTVFSVVGKKTKKTCGVIKKYHRCFIVFSTLCQTFVTSKLKLFEDWISYQDLVLDKKA